MRFQAGKILSLYCFIYSEVSALHMLIKLRIWKDASGCNGRASDFNASDKIKRMRLNVERAGKSHLHSQKYSTDKRVIPMRKHARPARLKFAVPYRSLRISIDYKRTSGSHFTICIDIVWAWKLSCMWITIGLAILKAIASRLRNVLNCDVTREKEKIWCVKYMSKGYSKVDDVHYNIKLY